MAQPIDIGLVQKLLAGVPSAQPSPTAPSQYSTPIAPGPADVPANGDPPDIAVTGKPLNKDLGFGIVKHGAFSAGHTLGNILGALGDAFLVQGGANPIYQPRMQQLREAKALENFNQDPETALNQYIYANPRAGLKASQQHQVVLTAQQKAKAYQDRANAYIDQLKQKQQSAFEDRAAGILNASNESTFPSVLAQVKARGDKLGFDTSTLPASWDDAKSWAMGSVPVKEQVKNAETERYHRATNSRQAARDAAQEAVARGRLSETRGYHQQSLQSLNAYRARQAAHLAWEEAHPTKSRGGAGATAAPGSKSLVKDPVTGLYKVR